MNTHSQTRYACSPSATTTAAPQCHDWGATDTRAALPVRVILAATMSTGLLVHSTAGAAAQDAASVASAEKLLTDLVDKLSDAQVQVRDVEAHMGFLRENANKARVDFAKTQQAAQLAQNRVNDAKQRLTSADSALAKAQERLDVLARSVYNRGGGATPIGVAASGANSVADVLARQSFLSMQAKDQAADIERLDRARTKAANEEAELRQSREEADAAFEKAVAAYEGAAEQLSTSQRELAAKQRGYEALVAARDKAQAQLNAARRAVDRVTENNAGASSWEKRRAAEAAVAKAAVQADAKAEKAAAQAAARTAQGDSAAATETAPAASQATAQSPTEEATQSATEAPATARTLDLPGIADLQQDFGRNDAGDKQRQQALTGLLDAGAAAAMAGFTAIMEGNGRQAGDAALEAGRSVAATVFDDATGAAATGEGGADSQANSTDSTDSAAGESTGAAADTGLIDAVDEDSTATATGTGADATTGTAGTGEATDIGVVGPAVEQGGTGTGAGTDTGTGTTATGTGTGTTTGRNPLEDALRGIFGPITGALNPNGSNSGAAGAAGTGSTGTTGEGATGDPETRVETVVARAMSQIGVTYAWGGGNHYGPTLGIRDGGNGDAHGDYAKVGFDCSGLMMYAFSGAGILLDHYSGYQYQAGRQVPVSEAKRGDMLFWGAGGSQHVALYLGNGQMIEAPQSGSNVKISDVRWAGIQPYAVRLIE